MQTYSYTSNARQRSRCITLLLQKKSKFVTVHGLSFLIQCQLHVIRCAVSVCRVPQRQGGGYADVLMYFKCPSTQQVRCPVNAYLNSKFTDQFRQLPAKERKALGTGADLPAALGYLTCRSVNIRNIRGDLPGGG